MKKPAQVKTGFWMSKTYSERAQALAKSRGVRMGDLLAECVGIGLGVLETPEDAKLPEPERKMTTREGFEVASLSHLIYLANTALPSETQKPARHKPARKDAKPWRFT